MNLNDFRDNETNANNSWVGVMGAVFDQRIDTPYFLSYVTPVGL